MLADRGHRSVACNDRLTRRGILRVGGLTLSGLVLGDVSRLRAESPSRAQSGRKSVIMIHLSGGPSHLGLGIDPATAFSDHDGRPLPILDDREPVRDLL
jgi:hypothetical protein